MSALKQVMQVVGSHNISNQLLQSDGGVKSGGLISNAEYAWFASGANIIIYSKQLGSIVSSRSFTTNQKDKSFTIVNVQELHKNEGTTNMLLVGCSCKSYGLLFVCQLPTLTTIRCIHIPHPISYISIIYNESLVQDQLCDEFNIMSTVLLVGMATGAVYAVDLRHRLIEDQLRKNEIVVNESRPSKLFFLRKNEDCQDVKEMSDDSGCHLAIFINENFCNYCKSGKLNFKISSLLYIEEINTVAIGYSTGHFQLWDCKVMRTIYLLKEPKCVMPVTHITFLEPSDDPNNLCYLWVIQSDNSRLPNATMIALTYEQRTMLSNGCISYRLYKGIGIKLEMSLRRETGIGRCISALTLCNVNLFRNENDIDEDCEIRLFAMLMEIRENVDASPESYIFLFDINQWYKAQMPSNINHLKVSNSYASFVKLPHNSSYLDLNISDKTLRPFGYNFRNNVEELYYPSSIYFECDCLLETEIVRFKHAGVQQEILDQLLLKNWRLLINPSLIFSQCLQTNLRPFFWDKTDDYVNYSLPDQRSFVISIIVENKIMSVLSACAEEWKNGTYVSSEATILHLVQCLWKHVMVVKQYADKLCVPLFDYSGTLLGKKNERLLNHCISQMLCVKNFLEDLHNSYGVHIINVDYSYRVYTLNLVTQYFKAVTCFLNYGLLPESIEENPTQKLILCDFSSIIQYSINRRMEFGDLSLYLIDAFVSNEPKGNKLIEQWQHEGGDATKGLYPPSNVQCLLRIYLNAALSNELKDMIVIYYLIDICASQEMDVLTANRMCNFALEFDIENKGLNTLCRASWLLDHDLFEDAMDILARDNEWMVNNKSWDWYHWTVMKLLVFKEQYFWARFYMQLTKVDLVNMDDHKFYVNLQIMNNQCFDTLIYLRARPFKEKQTLFEYFFDRCRETNRLKCLIEYLWDAEEAELFLCYLKRFDDTETLTFQLLFLLQRGRHIEAIKLNQKLKANLTSNINDALTITSLLVDGFEKTIPNVMKKNVSRLPLQSVYKKPNVVVKCMNNESKMFIMDRNKASNLVKSKSASFTSSNSIDLFLPTNNNTRKRSPIDDIICNEKRRKIDDNLLSTPDADNVIVKPIEKQVLEILNTPLVEKSIASPSITSYSSILKTKFATDNKQKILFNIEKTPRSSIRFSLPGNVDTTVKRIDPGEVVNKQQIDNPENESFYSVGSSDANDLTNQIISDQIPSSSQKSLEDNPKTNMSDEYEKMDISEEISCSEHGQFEIDDVSKNVIKDEKMVSISSDDECIMLTSDDEDDKKMPVSKLLPKNTSLPLKENIRFLSSRSVHVIPEIQKNISKNEIPQFKNVSTGCSILNTNSKDRRPVKKINKDIDIVLLDSDEDESDILSDSSSNEKYPVKSSDMSSDEMSTERSKENSLEGFISDDSDLENTRYGRFKSQKRHDSDNSYDGELEKESEDDDEVEEIEEDGEVVEIEEDGEEEIEDDLEEEYCEEEDEIEIEEDGEVEIEEDCEVEIEEDLDISEQYDGDSEESEREESSKQSKQIWPRKGKMNSEQQSEVCEENNLEHPSTDNLDEQDIKFDENDEKKEIKNRHMAYNSEYEWIGSENKDKRYDNDNDENKSGHVIFINEDEVNDLDQQGFECVKNEDYHSENLADKSYDKNEDNLVEEPDDASDEDNSEESDIIIDDASIENNSEEPDVTLESENEDNLEKSDVTFESENEENLEEPGVTLESENEENLEEPDVTLESENEDNLEKSDVTFESENEDNLEEPYVILDDANEGYNSEEPNNILVGVNDENLEEPDVILDDANEEYNSEEPNNILIGVNSKKLEEPDVMLVDAKEEYNSEEPDVILDDVKEEFNSEEPNNMLVGVYDENLEEPDIILDDDASVQDNEENSSEEVHSILDDPSEDNSSEEPDVLLDVTSEENDSEILEDASEENNSEESDVIFEDKNAANNLKSLETLKNEKISEKNDLVDSDKIIYPTDSQSNSLENLTPRLYDVAEETHSNDDNQICDEKNENSHSIIIEDGKTNDSHVIEDNDNVIVVETTDKVNMPISLDDIDNNKDDLCIDQNEDNHCDEYHDKSPNNDNDFEMLKNESNPIPDDGFNHLTMTGVEADQLEMDVDQSSPFMFGESFFGQQETPEKKPMLLFGHVYSFESEQMNVDTQAGKLETQESVVVNNEEDITNKEPEVETEGEIQDILELESLPDSNPDDNFDTQNDTDSNNLQPEFKKLSEKLYDNGQTVLLGNSHLPKPIYFGNINSTQVFEIEEQTPSTSVDLSKKSLELENEDLASSECCDLLKIKKNDQYLPNESEEQIYKTDKILPYNVENYTTNSVNTMENTMVVDDEKTCPISLSSIKTTTEPKQLMNFVKIQDAEELHSEDATSVVSCSSNIDQINDQLLKKQNITENINTSLNKEELESQQQVKCVQKCIELETTAITVGSQFPDVSSNIQNVTDENKTNLVENLAEIDKIHQKSSLDIPQVENYSLRSSSRRSISKTKECSLNIPSITEQKLTRSKKRLLSDSIQENKTSTSFVTDQIKKAESISSTDTNIITTRLRAKSEPKKIQLEPISSNIFRSSEMFEDKSRQVRVSLSKKRSKSQENISLIKRRSGRSKSLVPVEESVAINKRTIFGLEEIPEEDTSSTDKNILKTEHAKLKRKSKFNFLSNSSKKIESDTISPKCQQDTKIRTPRRSKSLQPDPVLTFSVVKTKPKRSSSVNMLISNDTEKDDLMGVLKKALNSPKKIRKRSSTETLKSRKKQKILNQVEEKLKEVAESEFNLNESNQSNHSSSFSSCEQISPIAGNVSQHILYTPAKKQIKKLRMTNLDSENEDSSSDESRDSKRIMTRSMIQNSSYVELDPIQNTLKSETRPTNKSKVSNRQKRLSVSNAPEIKTPKKSTSSVSEKDELLPKRKTKNIREATVHAPIDNPPIEPPPTSERRITRFQQSILDRSLQSTSVIGQDTTINNITEVPKPEKKKNNKKI